MIRRGLRAEGAVGIPRGPRTATRHNPLGLTERQLAILRLLAEGLSNKEIAARLRIAPKTVDHHVCAVLAKLEVSTRKQAAGHAVARLAREIEGAAAKTWGTAPDVTEGGAGWGGRCFTTSRRSVLFCDGGLPDVTAEMCSWSEGDRMTFDR